MFTIPCIFFGFSIFPSLKTIKPKIIPGNTINSHLFGFLLMPYSWHFWKYSMNFYKWLSMSLYTIKSSKNIFIKLSKYSMNVLVMTFWYVGGPFLTPNDITFHIKTPQLVINVVLYLSSRTIYIWWSLEYPSKKNMPHTLLLCSTFHLWKVMCMDLSLWLHSIFWNLYKFSTCHFY